MTAAAAAAATSNNYNYFVHITASICHQHCVQPVASDVEVVGYL